ncbi:MAG: hypothetical protein D6775_10320, partial [Caldilineae bacterium]
TATATPTPVPTDTPTPLPTPYAGPFRTNGGDYLAVKRSGLAIDGSPDDWQGVPLLPLTFVQQGGENWSGEEDLTAVIRLAWDEQALYLLAEVRDDVHVQELRAYDIFNGDSVELWLDMDLAGDFDDSSHNADDYQLGFSPGNFTGSPPEGVVWFPQRRDDWRTQLQVAARPQGAGYVLEAAVPWSILGVVPRSGMVFGFAPTANDNDTPGSAAQQTILMHTPVMAWGRPQTFSNLELQ